MEVSGQLHVAAALAPDKEPKPTEYEAAQAHTRSTYFRKEKNPLYPPGIESRILGRRTQNIVTIMT
jgi:hypothetical protein